MVLLVLTWQPEFQAAINGDMEKIRLGLMQYVLAQLTVSVLKMLLKKKKL